MSNICTELVALAINETLAAGDPLRDEEEVTVLSDPLDDRLEAGIGSTSIAYRIIVEAESWDDAYPPDATEPKDALLQLAHACLVAEAKRQVAGFMASMAP